MAADMDMDFSAGYLEAAADHRSQSCGDLPVRVDQATGCGERQELWEAEAWCDGYCHGSLAGEAEPPAHEPLPLDQGLGLGELGASFKELVRGRASEEDQAAAPSRDAAWLSSRAGEAAVRSVVPSSNGNYDRALAKLRLKSGKKISRRSSKPKGGGKPDGAKEPLDPSSAKVVEMCEDVEGMLSITEEEPPPGLEMITPPPEPEMIAPVVHKPQPLNGPKPAQQPPNRPPGLPRMPSRRPPGLPRMPKTRL